MSALVWVLLVYSAVTVTLLAVTEGIPVYLGMIYNVLCCMALACHAKTSLTDPASVPLAAIPSERQRLMKDSHSMCGQCQTFKPPMSHHCRICNRCISRMDHHCPWMNNCVGANNLSKSEYFITFLFLNVLLPVDNSPISILFRALSSFPRLHLDLCCLFPFLVWMELLFLCNR